MSKTKFNVLHKNSIVINGTKYRVNQLTEEQIKSDTCDACYNCVCGKYPTQTKDCINFLGTDDIHCTLTIGSYGYLSLIKHAKNKV